MEDRPKHLDKLRRKLQRFRDLRERDRNRYDAKASALWEHAMEARPMLYRHLLLEELSSSAECRAVTPPAEWSESIINDALKTAKQPYHSVYPDGGMHHVTDAGGKPASRPIYRTVECVGGPIRN